MDDLADHKSITTSVIVEETTLDKAWGGTNSLISMYRALSSPAYMVMMGTESISGIFYPYFLFVLLHTIAMLLLY